MKEKEIAIIIDGKKYEFRDGKYASAGEACDKCALREKCQDLEDDTLCDPLGLQDERTSNFQMADDPEPDITEEKVYDYYQERSATAGSRADMLAWMFTVMMTGVLISGHAYQTFAVCAALAALYMFFSIMQAVWQTCASWLFLKRIKGVEVLPTDYPSWVGGGAWLFFWLKMIAISSAICYFVHAIFF